jgi:hypothetical protein
MANEIHNYPLTATDVDNAFFDIDQFNGLGYDTKKVPSQVLSEGVMKHNAHASYYSQVIQTATSANTPQVMEFSQIDFEQGVQWVAGNKIKVGTDGVYNLQFSAQLSRTSGGSSQQISIWFRVNGTDIATSNTHLSVQANAGKLVAAWNYMLQCNANDEIQIMWAVTDTAVTLHYQAADLSVPHPATPSVIATINKV